MRRRSKSNEAQTNRYIGRLSTTERELGKYPAHSVNGPDTFAAKAAKSLARNGAAAVAFRKTLGVPSATVRATTAACTALVALVGEDAFAAVSFMTRRALAAASKIGRSVKTWGSWV